MICACKLPFGLIVDEGVNVSEGVKVLLGVKVNEDVGDGPTVFVLDGVKLDVLVGGVMFDDGSAPHSLVLPS